MKFLSDIPIICIPEKNKEKRFLLGKKGSKNLFAIGLNPSTASEENLDPTSRNIERLALHNNCNGWYLVNLYPHKTSHPSKLPKIADFGLWDENLAFIKNILTIEKYNITKVLVCWGDNIQYFDFLIEAKNKILGLLKQKRIQPWCMELTGLGNPYHPAPTPVNRYLGGISNIELKPYKW